VRFAALVHDLGKGITPRQELPQHIEHEARGVPLVRQLCQRLKVPRDYCDIALLVTEYHLYFHRARELRAGTLLKLFQRLDLFRRPERLQMFLLACEADSRGRPGDYQTRELAQPALFRSAFAAAARVDVQPILERGLSGKAIADELQQQRIRAIQAVLNQ